MDQQPLICPTCSLAISPGESLVFRDRSAFHLYCRRRRMLTPEERGGLVSYCMSHPVAKCLACAHNFYLRELAADPLKGRAYPCPLCGRDLTELVRAHLYGCGAMPGEVRRKALELRDAATDLVKQSRQLRDDADVLLQEAEVLLDEKQKALRQPLRGSPG